MNGFVVRRIPPDTTLASGIAGRLWKIALPPTYVNTPSTMGRFCFHGGGESRGSRAGVPLRIAFDLPASSSEGKRGPIDKDAEVVENSEADDIFRDHESLRAASSASIAGRIAFVRIAGQFVTKIDPGFGDLAEFPLANGKRCYAVNAFSFHCNPSVNTPFSRLPIEAY